MGGDSFLPPRTSASPSPYSSRRRSLIRELLPTGHCAVSALCTIVFTVHYTKCTVQFTLYSVHFTLFTIQSVQYSLLCILCTLHCSLYTHRKITSYGFTVYSVSAYNTYVSQSSKLIKFSQVTRRYDPLRGPSSTSYGGLQAFT